MIEFCLSFDIDWAHDDVIHDTLNILAAHQARATLFITHDTPTLKRIRSEDYELGIHPNFNPLLDGSSETAEQIFQNIQRLVPEATSVRSHSLVRSSRLSVMFRASGISHESNVLIYGTSAPVSAWRDAFGLIQVPIHWEDDVALLDSAHGEPGADARGGPLHVCNFHPIHVFLNSLTLEDYESTRPLHRDPNALRHHRRAAGSGGTRDRLLTLLKSHDWSQAPLMRELR